ncbi:MAG: DUF503 domain-containing protein [Acidobacteria bacterium]|nr:DUF503 domain-containing protein [Acidobacteriota bacterium]
MYVGVALFELLIPQAHSLKEKRSVVQKVKGLLRNRYLSAAEVGALELHQRSRIGAAIVTSDADLARRVLDEAAEAIDEATGGLLHGHTVEILPFDADIGMGSSIENLFNGNQEDGERFDD